MKKMKKTAVIATTLGLASMVLSTAACAYGSANVRVYDSDSSYEISIDEENSDSSADSASEATVETKRDTTVDTILNTPNSDASDD